MRLNVWLRRGSVCVLLALACNAAHADKKQDLEQLRERIEQLQRDLVKSEESRSEVADALRTSEKAISEVNRNLLTLGRSQAMLNQSLKGLARRISANRADSAQQKELLERLVRHRYMHGNTDGLRLMMEGRDASEAERQTRYLAYISRARAGMIARLAANGTELAELQTATQAQQQELAANAEDQKKARAALQSERATRQKVFNKIKNDISKGRREIGRLKRDEDRLSKLIDQLARTIAKRRQDRTEDRKSGSTVGKGEVIDNIADAALAGKVFQTLKGKLKLPVRGELQGRFGSPREEGGVTWKGLFIKSDHGREVHVVADGQVVYADWLRGYGNLLVIDHGGGFMSLYGNNESLLKQVGDSVQSGETVASVGSTGGALESGVYFELRHEGKPFDPMKWVGR